MKKVPKFIRDRFLCIKKKKKFKHNIFAIISQQNLFDKLLMVYKKVK